MARLIYKYPIEIRDWQQITVHEGAQPLAFQLQDGIPTLWCIVDTEAPKALMSLMIAGTGHEINGDWNFIGTIQQDGFVWHLFF